MIQHMLINKYKTTHEKIRDKNHMIILIDAEKPFEKTAKPLHDESPNGSRNAWNVLQYNTAHRR
jgi:hypothetical protein